MTQPDPRTETQREVPGVIVQAALEDAPAEIDSLDMRRWAGWVTYLLEVLESRRPDEIAPVLQAVRDGIDMRLEVGRW